MAARKWVGLVLILVTAALTGCAPTIAAVLLASGKSSSGGGINSSSSIAAAVQSGNTGTVAFEFTLVDNESDTATVEIRRSVDPNDDSTKPFTNMATGTFTRIADGVVLAANALTTSPSGVTYRFSWDTALDVGAIRVEAARLQVVLGSAVEFTTATFVVDNTQTPLVTAANLGSLPNGAVVYADEQNATGPSDPGFIPVQITLADAESSAVTLSVLYSTDLGVTFPPANVAAGQVVDGSGVGVPSNAIPTSAGGITYTFRFQSTANGLGSGGAAGIVLQFTAKDTKVGAPRSTAAFALNNAPFTASASTPSSSQITDKVIVPFALIDPASPSAGLDVSFQFSLQSGQNGTFSPATAILQPPAPAGGFTGLAAAAGGTQYSFVWNAFHDMVASRPGTPVYNATNVVLQAFVRRPSTQVTHGPFRTLFVNVDHRLIHTVFSKSPGVTRDGVPGTSEPLGAPADPAFAGTKVFFVDQTSARVRSVDLTTGLIDTAAGGGTETTDGSLATDYKFSFGSTGDDAKGLAASSVGFGALFLATIGTGGTKIVRVDLATPSRVRTIATAANKVVAVIYEPTSDKVFYLERSNQGQLLQRISANPATGELPVTVAGGGMTTPDDVSELSPPTSARFDGDAATANFGAPGFGQVFLLSERSRILAINLGTTPRTVFGVSVSAGAVRTVLPPASMQNDAEAIALGQDGVLRYAAPTAGRVYGVDGVGAVTTIAGTGGFNVSGDGGPAIAAGVGVPFSLCGTAGSGYVLCDGGFRRVREVRQDQSIRTLAGNGQNDVGDTQPSVFAQFRFAFGVCAIGSDLLVGDSNLRRIDRVTTGVSSTTNGLNVGLIGVQAVIGSTVYAANFVENAIRRLNPNGTVDTIAGTPGVEGVTLVPTPALQASLSKPQTVAFVGPCIVIGQEGGLVSAVNMGTATASCMGVSVPPNTVVRVAGDPLAPPSPPTNGAMALGVSLRTPHAVVATQDGSVYICDRQWGTIFKVDTSGVLTIVAGQPGSSGDTGDGGAGPLALLNRPNALGLSLDERVLYVASNNRIRAINLSGSPVTVQSRTIDPGEIETIAGNGTPAASAEEGNGIPAISAPLQNGGSNATSIQCDEIGRVFFIASGRVKFVDAAGIIRLYAGLGPDGDGRAADNAALTRPTALAVRPDGAYAVCDFGRVRFVPSATSSVLRIAGTGQQLSAGDGASVLRASFNFAYSGSQPLDVVQDANGPRQMSFSSTGLVTSLLAITDTLSNRVRIVNVGTTAYVGTSVTVAPGEITAVGGAFNTPEGAAFLPNGILLVSDTGANQIVAVNLAATAQTYSTFTIPPGEKMTILAGLDSPRNLAIHPGTGFLAFQQGDPVGPPRIMVYNPSAVPVNAYGSARPPATPQNVSILGPNDRPRGVAIDPSNGDLYFAVRSGTTNAAHNVFRIRFLSTGFQERVAGDGTGIPGFAGDGAIAISARLDSPFSIGVDQNGVLLILDGGNLKIRRCRQP